MNVRLQVSRGLIWLGGGVGGAITVPAAVGAYGEELARGDWRIVALGVLITAVVTTAGWLLAPRSEVRTTLTGARMLSEAQARKERRRAMVALVSPYSPRGKGDLTPEEEERAIREGDLTRLKLRESNLLPLLQAIDEYKGSLEHCWLVATARSLPSARLVHRYAREVLKMDRCEFHLGKEWVVTKPHQAQVGQEVMDTVSAAVRQARDRGIRQQEIITEVTGGTVAMSIGAVFACAEPSLDVQYTATWSADDERLEPMVFRFETRDERPRGRS